MDEKERQVVQLIREAFRDVKLGGGIGLREGQAIDDYLSESELRAAREQDEKEDWTRIPGEELCCCHSSLSFFDAEGMRFHLPAFLVGDLEGTYNQDVVFNLTYDSEHCREQFQLLNEQQREAVRQYLLLQRTDEFRGPLIDQALCNYWNGDGHFN